MNRYVIHFDPSVKDLLTEGQLLLHSRLGVLPNRPFAAVELMKIGLETLRKQVGPVAVADLHHKMKVMDEQYQAIVAQPPVKLVDDIRNFSEAHLTHSVDFTPLHRIHAAYLRWCGRQGNRNPLTVTKLSKRLAALGFGRKRQGYGSGFACALQEEAPQVSSPPTFQLTPGHAPGHVPPQPGQGYPPQPAQHYGYPPQQFLQPEPPAYLVNPGTPPQQYPPPTHAALGPPPGYPAHDQPLAPPSAPVAQFPAATPAIPSSRRHHS